jgi:hypothetical protein
MQSQILRNTFVTVLVLLAFATLVAAGTSERISNFSRIPQFLPQGTLTTFDPPGSTFTSPQGINAAGTITGSYSDPNGMTRGFVRASNGTIISFDVPDAAFGTIPAGINPAGTIVGYYFGADFIACHSFVRTPDGSFATFDPAMSPNLSEVINPAGAITGTYFDAGLFHGFVRAANATVTTFDVPNACQTVNGTAAFGINPAGLVVGNYWDAGCEHSHGFVRSPDGTFTTIDVPNAVETTVYAINPAGAMSGAYFTDTGVFGFLRSPSGVFTTYSTPGFGFSSTAMNAAGAITGFYCDDAGCHGYLWTPRG